MFNFYLLIEKVAEAITRGAIKAVWAELRKPRTATDEEVTDEDVRVHDNLRARFASWVQTDGDGDPRLDDPAPDQQEGQGEGLGQEEG